MDEVAPVYDHTIPAHVRDHYLRKRVAFVRRRVEAGRILDIGCGTGLLDVALREIGFEVIGIDESLGMLRECRRTHTLSCLCGDASNLPLATGSFEAVICVATLHHLVKAEDVRAGITEMLRVVKPGGCLILWDHNPLNPYWPFLMKRVPQDQEPTRLVPLPELLAALATDQVGRIEARRSGLVPDFAPRKWLWLFQAMEWIVEHTPGLRWCCAHNVILAVKATVGHGNEHAQRCASGSQQGVSSHGSSEAAVFVTPGRPSRLRHG